VRLSSSRVADGCGGSSFEPCRRGVCSDVIVAVRERERGSSGERMGVFVDGEVR
jgi:hypothetical protein